MNCEDKKCPVMKFLEVKIYRAIKKGSNEYVELLTRQLKIHVDTYHWIIRPTVSMEE